MCPLNDALLIVQQFQRGLDIKVQRISSDGFHKNFDQFIARQRSFDRISSTWDYLCCPSEPEVIAKRVLFEHGSVINLYTLIVNFKIEYIENDYWARKANTRLGFRVEAFSMEELLEKARDTVIGIQNHAISYFTEKYGDKYTVLSGHPNG